MLLTGRVLRVRLNCSSHVKSRRLQNDWGKGREKKGNGMCPCVYEEREEKQRIHAQMEFRGNRMETANGPSEKSADYSDTSIPAQRVQCSLRCEWTPVKRET